MIENIFLNDFENEKKSDFDYFRITPFVLI